MCTKVMEVADLKCKSVLWHSQHLVAESVVRMVNYAPHDDCLFGRINDDIVKDLFKKSLGCKDRVRVPVFLDFLVKAQQDAQYVLQFSIVQGYESGIVFRSGCGPDAFNPYGVDGSMGSGDGGMKFSTIIDMWIESVDFHRLEEYIMILCLLVAGGIEAMDTISGRVRGMKSPLDLALVLDKVQANMNKVCDL